MSYGDLEEARAKRAAKETANVTADKGKRGRNRKSQEPEAKVARMSDVPEPATAPIAPWRAPLARMYQDSVVEGVILH